MIFVAYHPRRKIGSSKSVLALLLPNNTRYTLNVFVVLVSPFYCVPLILNILAKANVELEPRLHIVVRQIFPVRFSVTKE